MPWTETSAMDERVRFIADWLTGRYSKCSLCEAYGISRPTGDKWINRYQQSGAAGLQEQSRAPHRHSNAVPAGLAEQIVQAKLAHQDWGPKKVMDWLRREQPGVPWPVDSTAGEILQRAGLVRPRKRRRRVPGSAPLSHATACNRVWSADFKGDFRLGNGRRCYPLTVSDNCSRYLLACRGLSRPSYAGVQPWFEWVFRAYGLPAAIRTDNGTPFASLALGGLSRLSAWWVRLGIVPERIAPGKPSQNGRHERMHRSLKAGTLQPMPAANLPAQQRRFNRFVQEYNEARSHEALRRQTPASCYQPSGRCYPVRPEPVTYATDQVVRRVRSNGEIKWRGALLYVTEVLAGETVGLRETADGLWEVRYSFHPLGWLDERQGVIRSTQPAWMDK